MQTTTLFGVATTDFRRYFFVAIFVPLFCTVLRFFLVSCSICTVVKLTVYCVCQYVDFLFQVGKTVVWFRSYKQDCLVGVQNAMISATQTINQIISQTFSKNTALGQTKYGSTLVSGGHA